MTYRYVLIYSNLRRSTFVQARVWHNDIDNTTNRKEMQNEERTFRFTAHSTQIITRFHMTVTRLLLPSSPPPTAPPHQVIPVPPCVPHPVPPSTTVHHLRLYSLLTASLSTDFEQDVNMSESSSDLEPIHAAHLPDRAFSLMTIPLDGLRPAIDRANRSVPSMALPIPLPQHHTTSADMNYGSESSAAGLNDYDYPDPYGSSFPLHLPHT
jgi:hypothetical protein